VKGWLGGALIDAIRHRPALRRLCGWETLGEVHLAFGLLVIAAEQMLRMLG
jgi:hypothetical protein